jgi:hypothetical protein
MTTERTQKPQIEFETTQDEAGDTAVIVVDGEEVGEISPPQPEVTGAGYTVVAWNGGPGDAGWSHELRPGEGFDDAKQWAREHAGEFAPLPAPEAE